jgi:hypothetical protein
MKQYFLTKAIFFFDKILLLHFKISLNNHELRFSIHMMKKYRFIAILLAKIARLTRA